MPPIPLKFRPGIQRDGTNLDSDAYIRGLWTRFRLGRPRKMGGYHMAQVLDGIGRRIHMFYSGPNTYVHVGTSTGLTQIVLDNNGNVISMANRTPAAFAGGLNPGWSLDALFDTLSNVVTLIAHSVPNLDIVANNDLRPVFSGDITASTPLIILPGPTTTDGGTYSQPMPSADIFCVQPYLFSVSLAGFVQWSPPNIPNGLGIKGGTSGAGNARVSAQKMVTGMPLRGGGTNSPAALLWSLSEVITANFVGSANGIFAFNTVSPNASILSAQCVIEYDGIYYWIAHDRFLAYNGTVIEVPNTYNQDFFFDNLNRDAAGKCFSFKVPRYGEIWFCGPLFGATEPNYAIIYNVREQCWYDTALPNGGRTSGFYAQGLSFPVMTSPNGLAGKLWLHEIGKDQTGDGAPVPIRSYFETPFLGGPVTDPPTDKGLSFQQLECDIRQSGDMVVWVAGSWNARGGDVASDAVMLKANPEPKEQLIGFKTNRRIGRLHFESYTLGGDFITGKSVLHVETADGHKTGSASTPALTEENLPTGAVSPPFTQEGTPLSDYLPLS